MQQSANLSHREIIHSRSRFFFIRHNELSLRVVNYKGRNIFARFQHSAFCHGDSLKFSTTHLSQISKRDHHHKRKKKKRDIFQSVTNQ